MITVGGQVYIEVTPGRYCDGWPGAAAVTDDAPGLVGHGQTEDEASADLVSQYESITWH